MDEDLILDVGIAYGEFRQAVRPLVANYPEFAETTLTTVLEYLQDEGSAVEMLQTCADDIAEALSAEKKDDPMPPEDIEVIKEQVFRLAEAIYNNLQDVGAYDRHGKLGFKFKQFLGKDIVLEPMGPDDYGTPADHDGEDDDDPYANLVADD